MRAILALLLLLAAAGRSDGQQPVAGPTPRQGGAWQLTTAGTVVAGQPSVTLELDALNLVRGAVVSFRPALYLRCLDGRLEVFVATGAVRDRDADYRAPVRLRWADRPAQDETWSRSTDYAALFAPDPAAFIRQLLATPELTFEFRLGDTEPIVARFNGAGLDAYLDTLDHACRAVSAPRAPAVRSDSVYAEGQVDERAELLSMPVAEYPAILRRAGIQGTVIVQAVVDTLGRVVEGSPRVVTSASARLNEPALNAVRRAVFRPARVRGRPVFVRLRLPIDFQDD